MSECVRTCVLPTVKKKTNQPWKQFFFELNFSSVFSPLTQFKQMIWKLFKTFLLNTCCCCFLCPARTPDRSRALAVASSSGCPPLITSLVSRPLVASLAPCQISHWLQRFVLTLKLIHNLSSLRPSSLLHQHARLDSEPPPPLHRSLGFCSSWLPFVWYLDFNHHLFISIGPTVTFNGAILHQIHYVSSIDWPKSLTLLVPSCLWLKKWEIPTTSFPLSLQFVFSFGLWPFVMSSTATQPRRLDSMLPCWTTISGARSSSSSNHVSCYDASVLIRNFKLIMRSNRKSPSSKFLSPAATGTNMEFRVNMRQTGSGRLIWGPTGNLRRIWGPLSISEESAAFISETHFLVWSRSTGLECNTRSIILPRNLERLEWDPEMIIIHSCHLLWEADGFQKGAAPQCRRVIVKVFVPHVRISPRANYFLRAPLPASFTFWDTHIHQCVWISQATVNPHPHPQSPSTFWLIITPQWGQRAILSHLANLRDRFILNRPFNVKWRDVGRLCCEGKGFSKGNLSTKLLRKNLI